jgi:hypothetical protein
MLKKKSTAKSGTVSRGNLLRMPARLRLAPPPVEEIFVVEGITKSQIIELLEFHLGVILMLDDPRMTRERCQEFATGLGSVAPGSRQEAYPRLLVNLISKVSNL